MTKDNSKAKKAYKKPKVVKKDYRPACSAVCGQGSGWCGIQVIYW